MRPCRQPRAQGSTLLAGLSPAETAPFGLATICPLVTEADRQRANGWVRAAIRNGQFDRRDWRNGFPPRIWYRDGDGRFWQGMLTNQGAGPAPVGQYKGWPIDEDEWRALFR